MEFFSTFCYLNDPNNNNHPFKTETYIRYKFAQKCRKYSSKYDNTKFNNLSSICDFVTHCILIKRYMDFIICIDDEIEDIMLELNNNINNLNTLFKLKRKYM